MRKFLVLLFTLLVCVGFAQRGVKTRSVETDTLKINIVLPVTGDTTLVWNPSTGLIGYKLLESYNIFIRGDTLFVNDTAFGYYADVNLWTQSGGKLYPTTSTDVIVALDSLRSEGDVIFKSTLTLSTGTSINEFSIDGTLAGNSDDALPTEQAVKTYVDALVTAQDLDFIGDAGGASSVDLDSQTFTIAGTASEIETSSSGQTLTIGLPATVAVTTKLSSATYGSDGSVSDAELLYINSLTSNAQTQLNNKQPLDADLTALAALGTTGMMARTAANTYVMRTITGTANEVEVSNGTGVSGNPVIGLPNNVTISGILSTDNISGITTDGDIVVNPDGTGVISVVGTTNYETNVTFDDAIPNKKYVDDYALPNDSGFWSRTSSYGGVIYPTVLTDDIWLHDDDKLILDDGRVTHIQATDSYDITFTVAEAPMLELDETNYQAIFGNTGENKDFISLFRAASNTGTITYMEDEDRWDFSGGGTFVQDLTNTYGLEVTRNLNEAGSSSLAKIYNDHATNTQAVLELGDDGTGVHITTRATNEDLEIDPNGTGLVSISGDATLFSATTLKPELNLVNTNADANAAEINFYKRGSGSDEDVIGTILAYGYNDGAADTEFAKINFISEETANNDEGGRMDFLLMFDDGTPALESFLDMSADNGSPDQGYIEINKSQKDIDVIINSESTADALIVQGSDGNIIIANSFIHTPDNTGDVVAATGITLAMLSGDMRYNGSGAIDITAVPQIVAGADGQVIKIIGLSDANTLTLDDANGLQLVGAAQMILGRGDVISFTYVTSLSVWIENFRSNN